MSANGRVHVPSWRRAVLGDGSLDPTSKLVALAMSAYMNTHGEGHPSKKLLARGCSIGARTVDRAILRVEERGYLDVQRSVGRTPNVYQATIPQRCHR